ncbi:hypothetical protein Scep_004528 [Stephania cephalantha]|uniref:Uncharacterized protein n=1 Tax=Stephania cephalantha TaxID=152367 RepID=A0AAP0KU95_9MAGN
MHDSLVSLSPIRTRHVLSSCLPAMSTHHFLTNQSTPRQQTPTIQPIKCYHVSRTPSLK